MASIFENNDFEEEFAPLQKEEELISPSQRKKSEFWQQKKSSLKTTTFESPDFEGVFYKKEDKELVRRTVFIYRGTMVYVKRVGKRIIKKSIELYMMRVEFPKKFCNHQDKKIYPVSFRFLKKNKVFFVEEREYDETVKILKKYCILSTFTTDFIKISKIDSGSFGEVWKVKKKSTNSEYAAKIFNKADLIKSQCIFKSKGGVLNEIKIMRRIDHPNLLKLYHIYETSTEIIFILDLMPFGDMQYYISDHEMNETLVRKVMRSLIISISYLHENDIIHRDIKPENILIKDINKMEVRLADFGLSTMSSDTSKFRNEKCGTPGYVAPEIFRQKIYDEKVDVYSAGVVFYYLIVGVNPFRLKAKRKSQIVRFNKVAEIDYKPILGAKKLSEKGLDLMKKMLEADPEKRLDIEKVLEHPWITMEDSPPMLIDNQRKNKIYNAPFMNMEILSNKKNNFDVQNLKPNDFYTSKVRHNLHPVFKKRNSGDTFQTLNNVVSTNSLEEDVYNCRSMMNVDNASISWIGREKFFFSQNNIKIPGESSSPNLISFLQGFPVDNNNVSYVGTDNFISFDSSSPTPTSTMKFNNSSRKQISHMTMPPNFVHQNAPPSLSIFSNKSNKSIKNIMNDEGYEETFTVLEEQDIENRSEGGRRDLSRGSNGLIKLSMVQSSKIQKPRGMGPFHENIGDDGEDRSPSIDRKYLQSVNLCFNKLRVFK